MNSGKAIHEQIYQMVYPVEEFEREKIKKIKRLKQIENKGKNLFKNEVPLPQTLISKLKARIIQQSIPKTSRSNLCHHLESMLTPNQ